VILSFFGVAQDLKVNQQKKGMMSLFILASLQRPPEFYTLRTLQLQGSVRQPVMMRCIYLLKCEIYANPWQFKPWAFEAREFMRAFAVGKEISFTSTHSLPSNDDVPRDIGNAEIGGLDLASELLKNGWGKLKDIKREPTDEDLRKRDMENEAKTTAKGLWNPHGPQVWKVLLHFSYND
jgi:hypothetical protein